MVDARKEILNSYVLNAAFSEIFQQELEDEHGELCPVNQRSGKGAECHGETRD